MKFRSQPLHTGTPLIAEGGGFKIYITVMQAVRAVECMPDLDWRVNVEVNHNDGPPFSDIYYPEFRTDVQGTAVIIANKIAHALKDIDLSGRTRVLRMRDALIGVAVDLGYKGELKWNQKINVDELVNPSAAV